MVWKALAFSSKAWADDVVVFNIVSGTTHLLNSVAAKILSVLKEQSSSEQEVSEKIAAENQIDSDKEILERVQPVLNTLNDLGLIEPVSR
jgi:PqqD family protein of HPr-rel-A system